MRIRHLPAVCVMTLALLGPAAVYADSPERTYREALELYKNGVYDAARPMFESLEDPLSQGYALLCAIKTDSPDVPERFRDYERHCPKSILYSQAAFEYGLRLFDASRYPEAATLFSKVDPKRLDSDRRSEYTFKRGYCALEAGNVGSAAADFNVVATGSYTRFTAPSQYYLGYLAYEAKKPSEAERWFSKSASDPRFSEVSKYYMVECRFLEDDYDFVISEGEQLIATVPEVRKPRLARMLSEAWMVKGDPSKARSYLAMESGSEMGRSDYFHAGSVLYGVGDYKGAVDSFTKMTERIDSLGQIANYQMGFCYVKLGNKVAAMDAFNEAAKFSHDADIQEDAAFNYAKLAFDVNHDVNGFKAYIARYSTSRKGEQIYDYMALAALVNHDYADAIEAYGNMESLNQDQKSNYAKANYLRAVQLVQAGSWTDAVPYLKAAAYNYPRSDRFNQLSRYWLGEASYKTDKYAQARQTMTELYNLSALAGTSEGELIPYNIASCYYQEGNWKSAARWYDTYLSTGSDLARDDAYLRRADCDFLRADYAAAAASYQKAIDGKVTSRGLYPYYRQGLSYGLSGDRKKKIASLSVVRNAMPDVPYYNETLYELGRAYLDDGDNSDALTTFANLRRTATDSTDVARSLIGMGMVYRNTADYDKALESYKQVISIMPQGEYSQDALLAIESIYQTRKQPEKYLEFLELNNLNSGKSPAEREAIYYNTAEKVYLAGNWQQATVQLLKFNEMYPASSRSGNVWFYLADSYRALGEKEKAVDAYAKAIEKLDGSSSFRETSLLGYASINYSLERWADAYDGYEKLLLNARMEANKPVAREGMLRSAFKAKEYEKAIVASGYVSGRESEFIRAKSLMAVSRRSEALELFAKLSAEASTSEGAEASFVLIQDALDRADLQAVESLVYKFSQNCGAQSYWLAKAYIALGDSFLQGGNAAQAKVTWESIRDGYSPSGPDDDVLDNVKMRLARL